MHMTQYPFPVASGGLRQAPAFRPLRSALTASLRQPDLRGAPSVLGLSGLGNGAGATILPYGQDADQSCGVVGIWTGTTAPSGTGVLQLQFPAGVVVTQTTWVVAADWATFAQAVGAQVLVLTWTATRVLLPREVLRVSYQWAVSQ